MKSVLKQTLYLVILCCQISVAGPATAKFSVELARFDAAELDFSYDEFEKVAVGYRLQLPVVRLLAPLRDDEIADSVSFFSEAPVLLKLILPEFFLEDIITAVDQPDWSVDNLDPRRLQLGPLPVVSTGEVRIDSERYLGLLLFPFTVDSTGLVWRHHSISISIGSRDLTPSDLVMATTRMKSIELSPGRSGSGGTEYLIVTSDELVEPMKRLATYKTATGIITTVELIDEILAGESGQDDAEKLRSRLIRFYSEGGRYLLLAGDETLLPVRYAYDRPTDSPPSLADQQICDLYFADLTGQWDADNDGVWGEWYADSADLTPELRVGRLPFNRPEEAEAYLAKLIAYETGGGIADRSYYRKAFFFSADQMRDYSGGGQHGRIASAYPDYFIVDTISGVEAASGFDPVPSSMNAEQTVEVLSQGFGIVNFIVHGGVDVAGVRTSAYNQRPRSSLSTVAAGTGQGWVGDLEPNWMTSFYYSLACDHGAFDKDGPPFNQPAPNLVQSFLSLPKAGAVAFVANSRWGWVGSSHMFQKTFFDSLFAHPDRPAIDAMYASKAVHYYYRDIVYGQNFYGDPTLRVYTKVPDSLSLSAVPTDEGLQIEVAGNDRPVADCLVVVSDENGWIASARTDVDGRASINGIADSLTSYTIAAVKPNHTVRMANYSSGLATDADEPDQPRPYSFSLRRNYPNPFNPSTVIEFELAQAAVVSLKVYNVLGQQVATLASGRYGAGRHSSQWDGIDQNGEAVAGGLYFYRLTSGANTAVGKMVLLK